MCDPVYGLVHIAEAFTVFKILDIYFLLKYDSSYLNFISGIKIQETGLPLLSK